jgi:hypothetical protein
MLRNGLHILAMIGLTANAQTTAVRHEVLITELMADPSPAVGLPAGEFIEVTNVSARTIDLKGWRVTDGNSTGVVPQSLDMPPGSRVILCSRGYVGEYSLHGRSVGLSGFPSLDNEGDLIVLQSPEGRTIHAVAYHPSWYGNAVKAAGGWSLEMIDTGSPCLGAENWTASTYPAGGSPGRRNSVEGRRKDSLPPRLVRTYAVDSVSLVAVFSESLDSASAGDGLRYEIDRQIGRPVSIRPLAPLFIETAIRLPKAMGPKTVYRLTVDMVKDCAGNPMDAKGEVRAGLPERAVDGQLRINEILFDPKKDGADYVEILNLGPGILDASTLLLGPSSAASQSYNLRKGSEKPFLLFPGDHSVFTQDTGSLFRTHAAVDEKLTLEMRTLPVLPDDSGSLVVMDASGRELDAFRYHARMHHPLLYDREGVALERVDPRAPTQDPFNWHSAASDAGYGSPTRRNSQFLAPDSLDGGVSLHPETLSPDMDGFDDLMTVTYHFSESGHTASLDVYDNYGRRVKTIARNTLCGTRGYFRWNGLDERNVRLPSGPYYMVMETIDRKGAKRVWRRPLVIAYRR